MNEETLNQLIEEYKNNAATETDEKKLAHAEQTVWLAWVKLRAEKELPTGYRREWVADRLGVSQHDEHVRDSIRKLGPGAEDLLWDRLKNKTIPRTTAKHLAETIRFRSGQDGIDMTEAARRVVAEYEASPIKCYVDGIPIRNYNGRKASTPPPKKETKAPKGKVSEDPEIAFFRSIRSQVMDYVKNELGDSLEVERMVAEFGADLSALTNNLRRAMKSKRERTPAMNMFERKSLEEACLVLRIDPPDPGQKVDLDRAKEMKKKLVREYHPDLNDNDPRKVEQYQQVIAAYDYVEDYNERVKRKGSKPHGNNGGSHAEA